MLDLKVYFNINCLGLCNLCVGPLKGLSAFGWRTPLYLWWLSDVTLLVMQLYWD